MKTIIESGNSDRIDYPLGSSMKKDLILINLLIDKYKEIDIYKDKYINLFCQGSSGAIMATIFAMNIPNCKIIHIKKDGEVSHSDNYSSTYKNNSINIIIDDFICTGTTVNRIANFMQNEDHRIDCLIISGHSHHNQCKFEADILICGKNVLY